VRDISQGSATTCVMCDGMFRDDSIADSLLRLNVEEFSKSAPRRTRRSCDAKEYTLETFSQRGQCFSAPPRIIAGSPDCSRRWFGAARVWPTMARGPRAGPVQLPAVLYSYSTRRLDRVTVRQPRPTSQRAELTQKDVRSQHVLIYDDWELHQSCSVTL